MDIINAIEAKIKPEAITGFDRIARHESFVLLPDLNMVQQVRIITVDEKGIPIRERIEADTNIPHTQKQAALARYQDQIMTKTTTDAYANAAGQVVAATDDGAIPQKLFFQAITLGQLKAMGVTITDETSVANLLYLLIGQEISNIDRRGDL